MMKNIIKITFVFLSVMISTGLLAQERRANFEKLASELKLDENQVKQVKEIMHENGKKLKELKTIRTAIKSLEGEEEQAKKEELREKRKEIAKATNDQLKAVLSQEQYEKYLIITKKRRQALKESRHQEEQHRPAKQEMQVQDR